MLRLFIISKTVSRPWFEVWEEFFEEFFEESWEGWAFVVWFIGKRRNNSGQELAIANKSQSSTNNTNNTKKTNKE